MERLVSRLPSDVQQRILSYVSRPQPAYLLDDIHSFVETRQELLQKYHDFWIVHLHMTVPEDRRWLLNDFFYYANHYKPTMFGYSNSFYELFQRGYGIQTQADVDAFVRKLRKKDVTTQLNIVLGLFTPDQRDDLYLHSLS